ncbi:hypothetical protein EUTSA_v10024051mg [Eutrema salsugineum]|uniref:SCP domain-containing protein n=1 Tax=Eutrema salsugineum TaxID=72664 RepID=V4KF65_EUTSA|nr:hypothetical protein EUTSA_v10024051mg [Eutrema salsugineum]
MVVTALVLAFAAPLNAQDGPQDYLSALNRVRSQVYVGPLVWHEMLAGYARSYARLRGDCHLILANAPYGKTIAAFFSDDSAVQAVSLWAMVRPQYNYQTNTCAAGTNCLQYTQVVWRKSVSVGCAKVRCDNGGTFFACYYDPKGNIPGERPY